MTRNPLLLSLRSPADTITTLSSTVNTARDIPSRLPPLGRHAKFKVIPPSEAVVGSGGRLFKPCMILSNSRPESREKNSLHCPSEGDGAKSEWVDLQLQSFEKLVAENRTCRSVRHPPRVATVLFRLMLLRRCPMVRSLSNKTTDEIKSTISKWSGEEGRLSKYNFHNCLRQITRRKYKEDSADKLFHLFDRDKSGDLSLKELTAGMSVINQDSSPDHALQYFFSLMSEGGKVPRYISKFELQVLIATYDRGVSSNSSSECSSRQHHLTVSECLHKVVEGLAYDLLGRVPISDFMDAIDSNPLLSSTVYAPNELLSASMTRNQQVFICDT